MATARPWTGVVVVGEIGNGISMFGSIFDGASCAASFTGAAGGVRLAEAKMKPMIVAAIGPHTAARCHMRLRFSDRNFFRSRISVSGGASTEASASARLRKRSRTGSSLITSPHYMSHEFLRKHCPPAVQPRADGSNRALQNCRSLFIGGIFKIAKHDDLAVARG